MKKIAVLLLLGTILFPCMLLSQVPISRLSLSGFDVTLIDSEMLKIEVDELHVYEKELVNNDVLSIRVLDQTGCVPKSSITIYTKLSKLQQLDLHNCKLEGEQTLKVDSLAIVLTSAFGKLLVESKYLSITAGAGSTFSLEGHTEYLHCNVGGAANISSAKLVAERGEVSVMGHSSLTANIKSMLKQSCEKSTLKNIHK